MCLKAEGIDCKGDCSAQDRRELCFGTYNGGLFNFVANITFLKKIICGSAQRLGIKLEGNIQVGILFVNKPVRCLCEICFWGFRVGRVLT